MWNVSQRELENLWNQVEVKKKKKGRECTNDGYMCVVDKMQEKKKKETYGWKKRQRIRNYNLKIIPQYFHNKF